MIIDMHRHLWSRCWFPVALDMARWKPNLYLEPSLWQSQLLEREAQFVERLDELKQAVGLDRVLFGSDCPGSSPVLSLDKWISVFRGLPELARRHGYHLTEEESALRLGGNAAKLLGVS